MESLEVAPWAVFRDVTLCRNQEYGTEEVARNWRYILPLTPGERCAGEKEVLAFTDRISNLFLSLFASLVLLIHCYFVILFGFSYPSSWVKSPRIGLELPLA